MLLFFLSRETRWPRHKPQRTSIWNPKGSVRQPLSPTPTPTYPLLLTHTLSLNPKCRHCRLGRKRSATPTFLAFLLDFSAPTTFTFDGTATVSCTSLRLVSWDAGTWRICSECPCSSKKLTEESGNQLYERTRNYTKPTFYGSPWACLVNKIMLVNLYFPNRDIRTKTPAFNRMNMQKYIDKY